MRGAFITADLDFHFYFLRCTRAFVLSLSSGLARSLSISCRSLRAALDSLLFRWTPFSFSVAMAFFFRQIERRRERETERERVSV